MNKWAICIYTCALLVVTYQENFDGVLDNYTNLIAPIKLQCMKESKVRAHLPDELLYEGKYVEDESLKCWLKCLYLKLNMLNEAGEISEEHVKKNVGVPDADVREKVYQKCKSVTGKDLCEKAFNLSKCTYDIVKESVNIKEPKNYSYRPQLLQPIPYGRSLQFVPYAGLTNADLFRYYVLY